MLMSQAWISNLDVMDRSSLNLEFNRMKIEYDWQIKKTDRIINIFT